MGNCSTQTLADGLSEKCGSSGTGGEAAAQRRRRRRREQRRKRAAKSGQMVPSSSSSSLSSSASESNNDYNQKEPAKTNNNDNKVQVIALGTELDAPDDPRAVFVESRQKTEEQAAKGKTNPEATNNLAHDQDQERANDEEEKRNKLLRLKEGLDFIETEEDVKAVEAATLKIQSTFRGKKIRSKVTPKPAVADKPDEQQQKSVDLSAKQVNNQSAGRQKSSSKSEEQQESRSSSSTTTTKDELELSTKVAEMQVQDNTNNQMENQKTNRQVPGGLPEEEAERAATKIQAGFKGYKTRKELEGKLPSAVGSAGGQQEAPAAAGNSS